MRDEKWFAANLHCIYKTGGGGHLALNANGASRFLSRNQPKVFYKIAAVA